MTTKLATQDQEIVELVFDAVPGRVYELRLLLQRKGYGKKGHDLSICQASLVFRNAEGAVLDLSLVCEQPLISELNPADIEVLPPCELTDAIVAGGLTSRFLIVPPDATRLEVTILAEFIECHRAELIPLNVLWATPERVRVRAEVQAACRNQRALLERHLHLTADSATVLDMMCETPLTQIDQIITRFAPSGNWQPVLTALAEPDDREDFRVRMERLRAQAVRLPRVGFIGSERGHERLFGMSEVFWLREADYVDQLALLSLDLVVIETVPSSGAGAEDTQWSLAFSSLDGDLPARGTALLEAAKAHKIPVHLWVTAPPASAKLWRGCAAVVAQVIAEGEEEDWSGLGRRPRTIPRTTEPVACSMSSLRQRDPDRMLIPVASDIFQYPDFAELMTKHMPFKPLMAEFRYRFVRHVLDERLNNRYIAGVAEHNRAHQRALLQGAGMVLLPAQSLRSDQELATIAMDAIMSGAIPVLFGNPRSDIPLLNQLDRIYSTRDLMELQALYRVHWLRERCWRGLMRFVMRNHRWRSSHRKALLGHDPFPPGFDTPRISAVLVTKRPHLLRECFRTFRRQNWTNKELILILNMDKLPEDMPKLRKNEYVFALPKATNIGECLNRGIAQSTGLYWAKIDDDDAYSSTYLEETVNYYLATQANVVGRQSTIFEYSPGGENYVRTKQFASCLSLTEENFISGATLSARSDLNLHFSVRDRNSADSNWVRSLWAAGIRLFSADGTSVIVGRRRGDRSHSWMLEDKVHFSGNFLEIKNSKLIDRLGFTKL